MNIILAFVLFNAVSHLTQAKKIVCYYGSWATYRLGNGKFDIENIDSTLCTHIVYAFAGLDENTNKIKPLDAWNDLPDNGGKDGYGRFVKQAKNKAIPMLAIGGWNEGSTKYSNMAASSANRKVFIDSVVALLKKHGFKGFDVDWEYPTQRGGSQQDKANYVQLLKELKAAFNGKYQLSVAVGVGNDVVTAAYDIPAIYKEVDHINLMLYDFHSYFDGKTGHNAPYNEVKAAISKWIVKGSPASKLILGTGSYGRSFTLQSTSNTGPNAPTSGPGIKGDYTQEPGYLGYNEICESKWTVVQESTWKAPYGYRGDQWVGYDDPASIKTKCGLVKELGLGGGMMWSIETDDFLNKCGGGKFALLKALNKNC